MIVGETDDEKEFQRGLARARDSHDELGELLDRFRPYLLAIARQEFAPQVAGKMGISDLVQDTLVRGVEGFNGFAGRTPEQLASWLRQILLNHARNMARAYGTDKRDVAREEPIDSHLAALGETTPSQALLARERMEQFQYALTKLPEELRQVIEMRHRDHRSFAEIGQQLGKSEDTARRIWARAIAHLQSKLWSDDSSR